MSGGAASSRASRSTGWTGGPAGGAAAVVLAAVVWGTTGTATHFAPGVMPAVFGAVTFGVGGLVLAARSGRSALRAVTDARTRPWVVVGAVSLVVYAVAFYAALADAGVALGTTVAIGSSAVFAGLVEWATAGRPVTRRWIAATLVSVAGMVVVTLARAEDTAGGGRTAVGLGAALVAGLTYATYSWAVGRGQRGVARDAALLASGPEPTAAALESPRGGGGVLGAVFGLAALPLVVLAVSIGADAVTEPDNWPVFLYLAVVPTAIGHTLYAIGLRTVGATTGTLLSLVEPVVAAVLAVLVVGEHLGVAGWAGVLLVVVGLGLLALPAGRSSRPSRAAEAPSRG